MAIIQAIVGGERDPTKLAQLRIIWLPQERGGNGGTIKQHGARTICSAWRKAYQMPI